MSWLIPSNTRKASKTYKEKRRESIENGKYHPRNLTGNYHDHSIGVTEQDHLILRSQKYSSTEALGRVVHRELGYAALCRQIFKDHPEIRKEYDRFLQPNHPLVVKPIPATDLI